MALVTDLVGPAPDPAAAAVGRIIVCRDADTVAAGISIDTGTAPVITLFIEFRVALHPAGPAIVDIIDEEVLPVAVQ